MTITEELLRQLQDTFADPVTFDVSLSNGTLSLFMWSNTLELEPDERAFIFGLVDQMKAWNAQHTPEPEPAVDPWVPLSPTVDELVARSDALIAAAKTSTNHYEQNTVPCEICGALKMRGAGMAAHVRSKHSISVAAGAEDLTNTPELSSTTDDSISRGSFHQ